jgi:molybdate transport system permease protein
MSGEALILSLRLACTVSAMLLVMALPLAYWLAFAVWRGKFLLESVVALPLVLPPTVLGFYALMALGPRGMLGRFWQSVFGHPLAFTFSGLVLASMLSSFESLDRRLLDASSMLGAGRMRSFFKIVLPLAWPGVITAVVLTFAHTLGEFGVVLMVGGNLSGITRTVSIDIYDRVQALDYAGAHQTALFLLVISFVVLCVVYGVNRRVWSPWSNR